MAQSQNGVNAQGGVVPSPTFSAQGNGVTVTAASTPTGSAMNMVADKVLGGVICWLVMSMLEGCWVC